MTTYFFLTTFKEKFITCIPLQIPKIGTFFFKAYLIRSNSTLSLVFEILSFENKLLPPGSMINFISFFKELILKLFMLGTEKNVFF